MAIYSSIEDYLSENGKVIFKIDGKSMLPMLVPNKDIITVYSVKNQDLHINDVVLYKKKDKLVLHRIVDIKEHEYVLLGDNCSRREYGILRKDIIGVLVCFTHNNISYDCHDKRYLHYVEMLRAIEPKRTSCKLIYDLLLRYLKFLPSSTYYSLKHRLSRLLITPEF